LEVHVFEGANGLGTDSSRAVLSGVISGTAADSTVSKYGPGLVALPNTNTYASDTKIYDGTIEATTLALDGTASSLGISNAGTLGSAAVLSFGDSSTDATPAATLRYVGSGDTTDRTVYVYGAATIDASGTGPLVWSYWLSALKTGANTITLTGTNTGNNQAQYFYEDSGASATSNLVKSGTGTWLIDATVAGISPANPRLRTGTNTISAGLLKAKTSSSIGLTTLGSGAVTLAGKLQAWNTTSGASSIQVSSLTTSGGSARLILGA
jgi:fibronectin-binding autotransporter adhesin